MNRCDPVLLVRSLGGIARTSELLAAGVDANAIRRAVVDRRELIRLRRGVLALPTTPWLVRRALAAGGALAATSAADLHGLWTPDDRRLHISVPPAAHVVPNPRIVIYRDAHHLSDEERYLVSVASSLRQSIRNLPFAQAVAMLDSALYRESQAVEAAAHAGLAPPHLLDLEALRSSLPARCHAVVDAADGRAEAGAESIARVRLRAVGVRARPQCWVARGIRVDLLIGDRLAIEIGSREFHANPDRYEADHARAAIIVGLGFELLEFTTRQVMNDWSTVEGVILRRLTLAQ